METTLAALDTRSIKLEVVQRGQRWNIDGVSFEVLHPPAVGPDGKENARSLVLHVTHGDWSMLLTGDLEEAGLVQVLQIPARKVDVLMAPHHGSDRSNIPALAQWARPKLVVSSQAMPISDRVSVAMYEKIGAKFLSTWPHGTITIRPAAAMPVETYRTKLSLQPF
jgi:competence protein ComEC